jgi:hypothetical protein
MAKNSRHRRASTDPILNGDGEVIRQLDFGKERLQADLDWLAVDGRRLLQRRFVAEAEEGTYVQHDQKAINVLKRTSYTIGAQLAARRQTRTLGRYFASPTLRGAPPRATAPSAEENPFFWCLHLFSLEHQFISTGEKTKSSQAMLYAYRNHVPPEFLTGFIQQVGRDNAIARSTEPDRREKWFDGARKPMWIERLPQPSG